jgi:DNA-binding SARP family transcriptional activator
VDVRILGPLELWVDGRRVELGGSRQRTLLAILALQANQVVSRDQLVDALWGDNPPSTAHKALQNAVSQLRRAFGPAGDGVVRTQAPGYVLELPSDALDSRRFEQLAAEGRQETEEHPDHAAELLREALALWRGEPLSDFAYAPFAQPAISRLEQLRLAATEDRIDADLSLGRHDEVVPELETLVASHPLDERLRGQLMLALYRSGRQAEALETYRSGRRALREELGLEPGTALRQLEHAILTQDPALGPSPKLPPPPARQRHRRLTLAVAAGLLAVAVGAVAAALLSRDNGVPVVVPDSLVKIDPKTNEVVGVIPVGKNPGPVAAVGRYVFTASVDEGTLYRVDTRTGDVTTSGRYDASGGVAREGGSRLWVASTTQANVSPVDAYSLESFDRVRLPRSLDTAWVTVGGRSLWVSEYLPPAVSRWNLRTLRLERRYPLRADSQPLGLTFGDGAAWVADAGRQQLLRIDGRSGRMTRIRVDGVPVSPLVAFGSVWAQMFFDGTVWRIDPERGTPRAIIPVPTAPESLAAGARFIWVADQCGSAVSRIDPERNAVVATIKTGYYPQGVAVGRGFVWVAVRGDSPWTDPGSPLECWSD